MQVIGFCPVPDNGVSVEFYKFFVFKQRIDFYLQPGQVALDRDVFVV